MIILIPSYQPSHRLVELIDELARQAPGAPVVVIDDGSGAEYREHFEATERSGAQVITHPVNRGKGAALRTGFRYALTHFPGQSVVTADSDGQHSAADIVRIGEWLDGRGSEQHVMQQPEIVLGSRRFDADVPARSQFGNSVSRAVFRCAAGFSVRDTQTGLRGIPADLLGWACQVRGDRFEYELEMLLATKPAGIRVTEIAIETIYLDENESSHFRPVIDSIRVMMPLLRFSGSSLVAFLVDTVALAVFYAMTGWLLTSIVAARLVSATMNFTVNRHLVFGGASRGNLRHQVSGYLALGVLLLGGSYLLLCGFTSLGVPLLLAKLATDPLLLAVSYLVQHRVVFGGHHEPVPANELSASPVA